MLKKVRSTNKDVDTLNLSVYITNPPNKDKCHEFTQGR
jgi:hypothetical protein